MGQTYRFNGRGMQREPSPAQRSYLASGDATGVLANYCPCCGKQIGTSVIRSCFEDGWIETVDPNEPKSPGYGFDRQWPSITFRLTKKGAREARHYAQRAILAKSTGLPDTHRLSRLMDHE